jgi:hypothetical protein
MRSEKNTLIARVKNFIVGPNFSFLKGCGFQGLDGGLRRIGCNWKHNIERCFGICKWCHRNLLDKNRIFCKFFYECLIFNSLIPGFFPKFFLKQKGMPVHPLSNLSEQIISCTVE